MAKSTLYNLNIDSPEDISDELYSSVGSDEFVLGDIKRGFYDLTIRTASGGAGTLLVADTDYTLPSNDSDYSAIAGFTIYNGVKVINAAYQACDLYVTYKCIGSYTDVETIQALLENARVNQQGLFRQAIINPDGAIAQRGASGSAEFTAVTTPANDDDTYLIDRWVLLSDGNDIVDVSQSTDAPEGSNFSVKFLVATANKKFGHLQILESKNSVPFSGKSVSVSFQAKTTAAKLIENLRCAVLSWDGVADTVTSDIVSAWNAEGANITPVANWNLENTPVNIAIDTNWTKYNIENISIDTAGITNLALFIWVDDTDAAANDELFIAQVQMNEGSTVLDYCPRQFEEEIALCQRYFCKGHNIETAPGTATNVGQKFNYVTAVANSACTVGCDETFSVRMRTTPTIHAYDLAGTIDKVTICGTNGQAATVYREGSRGFGIYGASSGAVTTRNVEYLYTADAEI